MLHMSNALKEHYAVDYVSLMQRIASEKNDNSKYRLFPVDTATKGEASAAPWCDGYRVSCAVSDTANPKERIHFALFDEDELIWKRQIKCTVTASCGRSYWPCRTTTIWRRGGIFCTFKIIIFGTPTHGLEIRRSQSCILQKTVYFSVDVPTYTCALRVILRGEDGASKSKYNAFAYNSDLSCPKRPCNCGRVKTDSRHGPRIRLVTNSTSFRTFAQKKPDR